MKGISVILGAPRGVARALTGSSTKKRLLITTRCGQRSLEEVRIAGGDRGTSHLERVAHIKGYEYRIFTINYSRLRYLGIFSIATRMRQGSFAVAVPTPSLSSLLGEVHTTAYGASGGYG